MKKLRLRTVLPACILGFLSMLATGTSNAALLSQTIANVEILGLHYDVTLWQDTSGETLFDQVYGASTMTSDLTFTNSTDAIAAAQVLIDYALNFSFDMSPYSTSSHVNGAVIPYAADTVFDYVIAYPSFSSTPTGPWTHRSRTTASLITSFAQFSPRSANSVPVPASLWLFGSGVLALLGVARRKGAPA